MTAVVETSGDLWLRDALGHEPGEVLSKADAFEVTAKIKAYAGVAWLLLLEAHKRQAHKAMGYPTWAGYVAAEFDMSKSRSYQLISQAKVILELTEAVSTSVDISEAEARDLAPIMDEVKAAAVDAVEALPAEASPEDKSAAVQDALDRMRESVVAKNRPKAPSGSDQPAPAGAAGPGDDQPQDALPAAASSAPKVAPAALPPAEYESHLATHGDWLAVDLAAFTPDQRVDFRKFVLDLWTAASDTLDRLDNPSRIKAAG